jgi:hypothetical protein
MFVKRICHDDHDPIECSGGRKLFYTAYGDPICDCPPGHFPYPSPQDDCLALFTQGPCRDGLVLSFSSTGDFICSTDGRQKISIRKEVVPIGDDDELRWLPADNGLYYPLGSSGPCRPPFLFDYDVFQLKTTCSEKDKDDDQQLDDETHSHLVNNGVKRIHDQLLNPCRPGKRNRNYFKCANSFL